MSKQPATPSTHSGFVNEQVYGPVHWLGKLNGFLRRTASFAPIKVNRKQILELAHVEHVPEAFGSSKMFQHMLNVFLDEYTANPHLSVMAVWGLHNWAQCCFNARKECMDYVTRHPEVLQQKIEKPVVILGMHRTGSTLLFNLMHHDENTRSTFMHEMYGTWPHLPVAKSRAAQYQDKRMAMLKAVYDQGRKILPEGMIKRDKAHPSSHDMIEEENIIGAHQMNWFTHVPMAGPKFKELVLNDDKDFVFKYMKIYLQMLQTGYAPASHWTLKSPSHLLHIDSFMRSFPDARLVVLHRDPRVTIPSMCYLIEAIFGSYWLWDTWDRRTLGAYVFELYQAMTQRLMRYRDSHLNNAQQFMDIKFSDLAKDPISQMQNIYRTFSINYDESLTPKLHAYLAQNPQHKHGKPDYTLESYGLSAEQIDASFAEYCGRYLS